MHSITDLPRLEQAGSAAQPLNICFVTREYLGFHTCGGIGTAVTAWAEALAEAGHQVTVLLTQENAFAQVSAVSTTSATNGNTPRVLPLPPSGIYTTSSTLITTAHRVFTTLASSAYDAVYFHDWQGQGYFSILAKRQGLAFENTLLCVIAHGSTPWVNEANQRLPEGLRDIEAEFMERQSVELADVLISPSRYMLSWMASYGWHLPIMTHLLPYHVIPPVLSRVNAQTKLSPPAEIVFFGRLEHRKGVVLFCDALDMLKQRGNANFSVTFLGRQTRIEGQEAEDYLRQRGKHWPFTWTILNALDRLEALEYLGNSCCLAVIPSLGDNSPNTVYECAAAAIPFIATDVGGIRDIIAPADQERVLFPPRPEALADKLTQALAHGVRPAQPAMAPGEACKIWLEWHVHLGHTRFWQVPAPVAASQPPLPLVSVCLTHHDRPGALRQALDSLKAQDYPNFEVVLVDDGSIRAESHALLDALEADFAGRGWTLVRQNNRYLGAARNACAASAKGEYLLFMDDDNLAKPYEISTFIKVARSTDADILTCVASFFEMRGRPGREKPHQLGQYVPLGGAPGPGFLYNAFGDANALVKTAVFHQLEGFTEDRDLGFEDWEFFAKAVLAGFSLQVVPIALFEYRSNASGMLKTTTYFQNLHRAMRPFLARYPRELAQAMLLCQGLSGQLANALDENRSLRHALEQSHAQQHQDEAIAAQSLFGAFFKTFGRILEMTPPVKAVRNLRRERNARLLRNSPHFDADWYLATNPDVAKAGVDPAVHYLAHGAAEGRNPNSEFDTRFYLDAHKDVARKRINPLVHYILHGHAEKRCTKAQESAPAPFAPNAPGAAHLHASPSGQRAVRPVVICPASDWAVSGAHTVTEHIGKALGRLGWDFRILFTSEQAKVLQSSNGRLPDLPHAFLPVDTLDDSAFTAAMVEYFVQQSPCILFCGCHFRANRIALHLPQHIGVVLYSHSDEQVYYNQSISLRESCDANICVSHAIAEKVRRMPSLEVKTHHIPNGGLHTEEVRFRSGWTEPKLSCVYTGRLIEHQKRVLDFIHLARALDKTGQHYQLSLIGQDFDGAEVILRRELAEHIRHGKVRLPGRLGRDELLDELDQHNFFVLLSEFEGFSLSLAEAMGRGCIPVVTAIESGNSDIVLSGHNGMIMPHRDYERWASWLCETSQDAATCLKMSHCASETIRSSFTIEHQVERIDALLRSCCKRPETAR